MYRIPQLAALLAAAALSPLPAESMDWTLSGYVGAELRYFPEDPLVLAQLRDFQPSVAFAPELYGESADGRWALLAEPYLRLDAEDDERTHADLRELNVQWRGEQWEVRGGLGKVFWGVTESRHLVDIINQTDLVENIDGEDKLGQPMVQVTRLLADGTLDIFLLPGFRERTFPGESGRLRTEPPVDTDHPLYESGAEEWHPDLALRLKLYKGAFDIGLSYFYGTSRDPLFLLDNAGGRPVLRPVYNLMQQAGLDVQFTGGPWLLKFEGIARSGRGQHFQALTTGFEYTFFGVFGSAWDVGLLGEYHYDSRGSASPDPFNNDIFVGTRIAPNDEQDTAFLLGGVTDLDNGTSSLRLEVERRLGSTWKLILEGQYFGNVDDRDPLYSVRRDSFLTVELRRYF